MKAALFKSIDDGYETISGDCLDGSEHYVRISEYVDVQFPPLANDEQVVKAVATLDKRRASVTQEFARKLAEIDTQKAELLAITHEPSRAVPGNS